MSPPSFKWNGELPEEVRVVKPELDGGAGDAQKLFIVAFDPGVVTGWCVMRIQLDLLIGGGLRAVVMHPRDPEVFAWSSGWFAGPIGYQAELMMALCRGTWMHGEGVFDQGVESDGFVVIYEGFALRVFSQDPDLLAPVRVGAAFHSLCWRAPFPVVVQMATDPLAVFTEARLRAFNLWSGVPGKLGEHQRDATRHAGLLARDMVDKRRRLALFSRMPWMFE